MKEKILVSACLLGEPCRYDGASKPCEAVLKLGERYQIIPFCPEVAGGLATPRIPAERRGDKILRRDGMDVTSFYTEGAKKALELCKKEECAFAVLKEKSPSCGKNLRYDGSFSGKLLESPGVTAELLMKHKIPVFSETEIENK